MKKSEWATPSGIDRDYNYLKCVERTIDDANQNAHGRGIGIEAHSSKTAARAWYPGSTLNRYLARNRIIVQHAPRGMSRQKLNQTRATRSGNIVWTVEWVDGSGDSRVQDNCLESSSLQELYSALHIEQRNFQIRRSNVEKSETTQRGIKRKREESRKDAQSSIDEENVCQQAESVPQIKSEEMPDTAFSFKSEREGHEEIGRQRGVGVPQDAAQNDVKAADVKIEETKYVEAEHEDVKGEDIRQENFRDGVDEQGGLEEVEAKLADVKQQHAKYEDVKQEHVKPEETEGPPSPVHIKTEDNSRSLQHLDPRDTTQRVNTPIDVKHKPGQYFYLLKPATRSASYVLIPLESSNTMTESLRDQVVQEYPTIYILPNSPDTLFPGFTLEKEYMKATRRETQAISRPVKTEADGYESTRIKGEDNEVGVKSEGFDAGSILNMLRRDVTI